jgi:hypothetical protein
LSARAVSEEQKQPATARKEKTMEFQSNSNNNPNPGASSAVNPRSHGKVNTQAIIAANIQHLIEQLEAGHSEVLSHYLTTMARFPKYSLGNVLLIASQKPEATRVAGIFTWNQLGRWVKRGEKGIMIFAPMISKRRNRGSDEEEEEAGEAKPGPVLVGFRPVYVFDVTQTEGKELPEMREVRGEARDYFARLVKFTVERGIALSYSEEIAPAKGISMGGRIQLLPDMSEAEQCTTLIHELAHEMLHKSERRTQITKTVRETEAEAIAFVVSKAIGLDLGTASSDYIQLYHGDAKLLQESLEMVQQTAAVILGAIEPEESPGPTAAAAVA